MTGLIDAVLGAAAARVLFQSADGDIKAGHVRAMADAAATAMADRPGDIYLHTTSAARFVAGLLAATLQQRRICLPAHTQAAYLDEIGGQHGILVSDATFSADDRADAPDLSAGFTTISRDPTLTVFTSGTTGTPKAVRKALSQLETEARALDALWGSKAGAVLTTVSHQHIYGLLFRIVWPILSGRPSADHAALYWEQLDGKLTPQTMLVSSPAHLTRLPESLGPATPGLIFSSGQELPFAAVEACTRRFATTPIEVLGSTETGGIGWRQRQVAATPWMPFAGVDVQADADGALHVYSPYLPGQDAVATGDGVALLADGRFHLRPRGDRVEKVEGRRVSLTRVEEALRALPQVTAAKTCTLPAYKNALAAVVVLSPEGAASLAGRGAFRLSRDLRSALSDRLEPSERPKHWRFVPKLPTDERGKHTLALLRALFFSPLHGLELSVIAQDETTAEISLKFTPDLIFFSGHFAERAVLPGMAQVHIAALLAERLWRFRPAKADLTRVKFSRVLVPDDEVVLKLQRDDHRGRLRFSMRLGDITASQGEIG